MKHKILCNNKDKKVRKYMKYHINNIKIILYFKIRKAILNLKNILIFKKLMFQRI